LFTSGILLRWDIQELGTDAAARLRGDLTPHVSAGLMTMARTDHAALTALALHLNQGPHYFTCWTLTDLTEDGAVLHEPARHQHNPPKWMSYPNYQAERAHRVGVAEIPCTAPIVIPEHARPIFAAHRAYRLGRTRPDGWHLFPTSPDASKARPATGALREAIIRTCDWLNLDPPWVHRDPCRHGADAGLRPRMHGWLAERGLSLHQLDPVLVAHLHRRYQRYHLREHRWPVTAPSSSSGCTPAPCRSGNWATCSAFTRTCCPTTTLAACVTFPPGWSSRSPATSTCTLPIWSPDWTPSCTTPACTPAPTRPTPTTRRTSTR
jgi:hypothetical protein